MGISLRNRVSCWSVLKHSPEWQTSLCPKCLFLILSLPNESQPPLTPANDWVLKMLHGSKFCRLMGTCGSAASPSFQPGVISCPRERPNAQRTHQESWHHPTASNPQCSSGSLCIPDGWSQPECCQQLLHPPCPTPGWPQRCCRSHTDTTWNFLVHHPAQCHPISNHPNLNEPSTWNKTKSTQNPSEHQVVSVCSYKDLIQV